MNLPSHPPADEPRPGEPPTKANRLTVVAFGAVAAALVLVVVLHLAGVVGPGAH